MKSNAIVQTIALLTIITSSIASAGQTEATVLALKNLTSAELLSCKTDSMAYAPVIHSLRPRVKEGKYSPVSLEYMNDEVKVAYKTLRNGVTRYVTKKVAVSLFNFSIDGLAPENIASYVSSGTQAFLPFEFANGVKITKVTSKGRTVIYRIEMPITISNSHAGPLAVAGRLSTITSICNDIKMVDDLLERHLAIQYDYYDSNGVFYSSFTINGTQEMTQITKKANVPSTFM